MDSLQNQNKNPDQPPTDTSTQEAPVALINNARIRPTVGSILGILPSTVFFVFFDARSAVILAGLHIFVAAYLIDYLFLFNRPTEVSADSRPAAPLHVFLVAWFLPFVLTVAPSLQLHQNPFFIEALVRLRDPSLFEQAKSQQLQMVLDLAATPLLARAVLFGSLVVLVPLELFALFYLQELKMRHTLIAAGCLDIAMLFFLLLVASDYEVVVIIDPYVRALLIVYFTVLWAGSLLSSFQAIWLSQHMDHDMRMRIQEQLAEKTT